MFSKPYNVFLSAALVTWSATDVIAGSDSRFSFSTGSMNYNVSDGSTQKAGSVSGMDLMIFEYASFFRPQAAFFTGYKTAYSQQMNRSLYQGGFAGARYYPFSIGYPIETQPDGNIVQIDYKIKPYFETSATMGRFLFDIGSGGAYDFSADTLAFGFGAGSSFSISRSVALDTRFAYEALQSRGGGPTTLNFSGTAMFILIGGNAYF